MSPIKNQGAPNSPYYTPVQNPPAGTALDPATAPTLFQPLTIRGMTLQNRIAVSPMCQYSAEDGHLTDWHFANLSQFILRGAALTIVEATAVTPNGRISPEDSGLWQDSQIAPLKRIADFAHSQGQKLGIQLAHAGRKASTLAPWLVTGDKPVHLASEAAGGWPDNVWAPSAIAYDEGYPEPKAMTLEDIASLVRAWGDAARRAVAAGVDCIEIHGAHGYLISEFLSPLTNKRTDAYGGSFENRTRLLFEIVAAVRAAVPADFPLLLRISATEWMEHLGEPTWDLAESVRLAKLLPAAGIDLLDVSSGGLQPGQKINLHPYYQIDLAGEIRAALAKEGIRLLIGAVGMVTNAEMARSVVQEGGQTTYADLVLVARQFLREPEFPLRVAHQLGVAVKWPIQYHRAGWPQNAKV
ncbi:NADPH dehydrogenase [Biscogniauxia mediterranea]|nr:NADPH dehydrogenase [Biscogniauxia mediterranea]